MSRYLVNAMFRRREVSSAPLVTDAMLCRSFLKSQSYEITESPSLEVGISKLCSLEVASLDGTKPRVSKLECLDTVQSRDTNLDDTKLPNLDISMPRCFDAAQSRGHKAA